MLRPSVLLLALAVTAPTVWGALADQNVPVQTMLVHYLVAVPVMAVLCALVRTATRPVPPREPEPEQAGTPPAEV